MGGCDVGKMVSGCHFCKIGRALMSDIFSGALRTSGINARPTIGVNIKQNFHLRFQAAFGDKAA